jgi:hypothetical protein
MLILYALEVIIPAHIRHGQEHFRKALPVRRQQYFLKYDTMFGFSTSPMTRGTLFENVDDALIKISNH